MKTKFTQLRLIFILFIISIVVGAQTFAQAATIEYSKATLISKFAKYVTWPGETRQSEFVIGVYDDDNQYKYFSDFFANKGVKGKDILVRLVKSYDEAKDVNILYIPSPNQRKSSILAEKILSDSQVLVVTEDTKDLSETMVNISYNKQELRLNFTIIDSNIEDTDLKMPKLSSFLDDNDSDELLSPSPSFIRKTQQAKQLLAHQELQKTLEQLNNKLNLSEEKSNLALQKVSERLKLAQQAENNKNQEVIAKDKKLQQLETQLKAQKALLIINKQDLQSANQDKTIEQEQVIIDITEKLEKLENEKEALKKENESANTSLIKLTKITKDYESQSSFKVLFYVFFLIAIIAVIIAYMMWKKAQDSSTQSSLKLDHESNPLLPIREDQLIKSENFAALGYIATDITYAVGLSLDELQAQLEKSNDKKNATTLKPVVTLLESFNLIAADQDDTKIQSFDVTAYIQKMLMLYDFEFSQSNIEYKYFGEKELTIKSVPSYIAIALINVINNSLKHGFDNNGNGKIAVTVEKGAKSGAKIIYSDDGKGMSKDILKQVFEPFFTTHNDRGYVGVGMSTTYDLIKNKLAGDIKIDSQEGKGTTVTIMLP